MIKDFTHIFVIMFNGKDTWAQSFQLDWANTNISI